MLKKTHDKNSLGERMKLYEEAFRTKLPPRMPVIIRIDGRAHHTYTKNLHKPFDNIYYEAIKSTMYFLCTRVENFVFGYCQSDEITLVLYPSGYNTAVWFDNEVQKLVSICASMATKEFARTFKAQYEQAEKAGLIDEKMKKFYKCAIDFSAEFDTRVFAMPIEDVPNNILWRAKDCYRNAIFSIARSVYSNKQLHGKKIEEQIQMLKEADVDVFNDYTNGHLYGNYCVKTENGGYTLQSFTKEDINYNTINQLIKIENAN